MSRIFLIAAMVLMATAADAKEPVFARKTPGDDGKWSLYEEILARVPPLKNDRGGRWPMIMWDGVSFEPQPREVYEQLLARGLLQHIRMDDKMIPTAKALQEAGSPVIMMQGAGGPWPASVAGDTKNWAHQLDPDFKPERYVRPCLWMNSGWGINADNVRATLGKFKDAGVTVDAVWMDWEGDPLFGRDRYDQAMHCSRCREMLPKWILASRENFSAYCWRQYQELTGSYLAAPVAEVFPGCSTTNWMAVFSTADRPLLHWNDRVLPPSASPMFTATNPVAYGNTVFMHHVDKAIWADGERVDQAYAHLLLRMVSDNAANCLAWAPEKDCFPWVARWCPDDEDPKVPIMSRARYREVLRHIWLRGADGIQIFQPRRRGYKDIVMSEMEDAVIVYDEMLAYRGLLDEGQVMCTDVPGVQDDGAVWSGLRTQDRAVVRAFKQGGGRRGWSSRRGPAIRSSFAPLPKE